MFGLSWIDIAVLVGYLVVTTAIGMWLARSVHSAGDFFMPRRYGKAMLLMFSFGAGTSSDQAVAVASKSYRSGLAGIWYQWLWLLATPFYWVVAVILRRSRAITTADMIEARFDRSFSLLYTGLAVIHLTVQMGVMLKGSVAVIEATSGGLINPNYALVAVTAMFLLYGVFGGLAAAIVTDFLQGLLTLAFSFILLPALLTAVGGMSGLQATLNNADMFSLASSDITLFYILIISLNGLIGIVAYPNMMSVCGASKSEYDSRWGLMSGNFVKRICTMAWCVTGLAAAGYYLGKTDVVADHIWGRLARDFLPAMGPGLLGLFLSGVLASLMSTCDAMMINCAALFTENLYKPLAPARSERHYLWVGRASAAAMVGGGLLFAFRVESVIAGIEILWCIIPAVGVILWLALAWRGVTVAGAWAGALAGFAAWFVASRPEVGAWFGATCPWAESWKVVSMAGGEVGTTAACVVSLPWQMVFYLVTAATVCIVTSWLTPKVRADKLDRFYDLMRTPVHPGEVLPVPCRLPEAVPAAPRRPLVPFIKSLEIQVPSRTTVLGFAVGWAIVAAMIGGFYWLTQAH